MPLSAFRNIQIGREASQGGGEVAGDTQLIGTLTVTPSVGLHMPQDERGSLALHHRDATTNWITRLRYQGDATYEQILHFLAMTLDSDTVNTPVGSNKARDYNFVTSVAAANAQDSYTFEYGDELNEFTTPFVVCTSFELGFSMGAPVSLTADMFGQIAQDKASAGAIASPNVNEILSDSARFYVNTTFANIGNTELNAILVGGTIRFNSGLVPVRYADGTSAVAVTDSGSTVEVAQYSKVKETRRAHSMDLDIITDANGINQVYEAYINRADRAIRIQFTQTGDDKKIDDTTSDTYRHLAIDMFGRFTSEPELFGERDGENMIRATFTSYDDGLTSGEDSGGNECNVEVRVSTDEITDPF